MSSKNILADVEYNPYAVLIAHIDGERFFRHRAGLAAFREASDNLTRECSMYYRELRSYLKLYGPYATNNNTDFGLLEFEDFLFNPACFVGFGDNDSIAFVAMDDFDLSTRLISRMNVPVRQTCLAFSPKINSLGLRKDDGIFCEIEDICNTPLDHDLKPELIKAPDHEYLRKRPLVAITYYKFNGMAVLGPGLLMQQAAYGAMAKAIENAIADIKKVAKGDTLEEKQITKAADSFRCALLDPQGWADLVSIMLCRDYSVIATVLARVRCLTHRNLYEQYRGVGGRTLQDYIKRFAVHGEVARAFKTAAKDVWNEDLNPDETFAENHVLCSTFSTFGISHEAFEATRPEEYVTGDVIADTKFVCSAGHCTQVKKIAKARYRAQPRKQPGRMWYLVGHNDFVYQQMLDEGYNADSVVGLSDFIRQVKNMRDCSLGDAPKPESHISLHVLEMSSDLRIPMINGIEFTPPAGGHTETRLVLDQIRRWLFEENHEMGLNLSELQHAFRRIQLPTPVSTSVLFLFLDYANCLTDVFLFDHVIDLHDVFAAVYSLLARELPRKAKERARCPYDARTFLDGADLDNLVELVELLRSALSHRMQVTFREAERWGITLDIRGAGFNRLLNAADVPLKCGLGLLWRVIRGDTTLHRAAAQMRDTEGEPQCSPEIIRRWIGGASRITDDSRPYSHRLDVGYNTDFFITSVDLNLAHLTRPRNLLIHFHEVAHLICHFLRDQVGCVHPGYSCKKHRIDCHRCPVSHRKNTDDGHLRNRFEDIFSEMLVHKLVFGDNYKTYLRSYCANYSIASFRYNNDPQEAFFRVFELLMRGFLITDPFRRPELYRIGEPIDLSSSIVEKGFGQFQETIADVSSFLLDHEDLLKDVPECKLRYYFEEVFSESYDPVRCIAEDIRVIYHDICEETLDPPEGDIDILVKRIRTGLDDGRPLIRIGYEDKRPGRDSEQFGHLDALFLVRHILREHICGLFGDVETEEYTACLIRGIDGHPDPAGAPNGKKWNRQCLDRMFNGLVAVDRDTRSAYMRERIVLIKTLWDISTNFRARRMLDILKTVWGK